MCLNRKVNWLWEVICSFISMLSKFEKKGFFFFGLKGSYFAVTVAYE